MLYPPKIENVLPAFTFSGDNVIIKIPYWLNNSVGNNDFDNIKYVIKTATTSTQLNCINLSAPKGSYDAEKKCYWLTITEPKSLFILGQHYKIQLAFINKTNNEVGYYSNVGVSKYVNNPSISVIHSSLREVVGTFSDSITHEKVYSYKFNLYDRLGNLLETSGEKIHNSKNDTSPTNSRDIWEIQSTLESDSIYTVKYYVTTTSNFQKETSAVTLSYYESIEPNLTECFLIAKNNFDEAYNDIYLKRNKGATDPAICGNFLLLRASSKDNYSHWEKLSSFQIYNWTYNNGKDNIYNVYKDYLIEQGISYRYAIQAYNKFNIYSTKMMNSNGPVYSDFEDIYLYDGERQLRIRYNAKATSFKSTILESKIDTIGSKYPTFFRNGTVQYREIGLSGLISMNQDAEEEFTLGNIYYHSLPDLKYNNTELTSYNFQKEREFKLQVLAWLTNGKEKVLKTGNVGNYIVRLMNTSLTPLDNLGGMLHSFTSMAYEVADYTFANLKTFNFIDQEKKYRLVKESCNLSNSAELNNFIALASNVKINQAIIYTQPNIRFKCVLGNGIDDTYRTVDEYGIIDLSTIIKNVGLKNFSSLQKKVSDSWNSTSWPASSVIEYSYYQKCEDTSNWYYVTAMTPGSATFEYNGQGMEKSMKDYINNLSTGTSKQIILNFPYLEISKKDNLSNYEDGYYVISRPELSDANNLASQSINTIKIYRNTPDCFLGEGLKMKAICPVKNVTLRSTSKVIGGVMYAI